MSKLIELQGAVRRDGKPFVMVIEDGEQTGQLSPAEAVNFGTRAIQAGIEAERDAALVVAMKRMAADEGESEEGQEQTAAGMLQVVRHYRQQVDPDPRQDHHPDAMDSPDA